MNSKIVDNYGTKTIKNTGKTKTNLGNNYTVGISSTQKSPEDLKIERAREIFEGKFPQPLIEQKTVEEKKEESKEKTQKISSDPVEGNQVEGNKVEESKQDENNVSVNRQEGIVSSSQNENSYDEPTQGKASDKRKREDIEEILETEIFITLEETSTTTMFFMPSSSFFVNKHDSEMEVQKVECKRKYDEKIEKNKELFSEAGSQTLNAYLRSQSITTAKNKDVQSETTDQKINALNWFIADKKQEEINRKDNKQKSMQKKFNNKVKRELERKIKNNSELINIESSMSALKSGLSDSTTQIYETRLSSSMQSVKRGDKSNRSTKKENEEDVTNTVEKSNMNTTSQMVQETQSSKVQVARQKVINSLDESLPASLLQPLKFVERLLSQNKFHFRQIAYKKYPVSKDEFEKSSKKVITDNMFAMGGDFGNEENKDEVLEEEKKLIFNENPDPNMKHLFTFSGKKILENDTRYVVHNLDWNPVNKDLLAAGYGHPNIDSKDEGLLLFWTLKNPLHPERVIKTSRGITSVNFSNKNPFLIAAADYAGEVMIYDLRVNSNKPVANSLNLKDKHTDIVWETKWIEKPNEKNESLVSISSDGKIKEWSLKKGLEVSDLLLMKKNVSLPDKSLNSFSGYDKKTKESLIFRDANGLSFDFPKNDSTIYYIALEECTLQKCRISYKDQYTDTYYGHQGPVYKVRCNPFDPNIFLSCSYDWTMKVWSNKFMYPILTCKAKKAISQVNDVEWSPNTSTIFGSVSDSGEVEIWDLSRQSIDPTIVQPQQPNKANVPRKSIKFSKGSEVLAVGDADFDIDIFRLYNLEHIQVSEADQIKRLELIMKQNSEMANK